MTSDWTSRALRRLDLGREELVDTVVRGAGLPATETGREIVDLHLCALDVSLEVGSAELLAPQLAWEVNRWAQVAVDPDGPRVWPAVREVLDEHLDELTLLSVVRHAEEAHGVAATRLSRARRPDSGLVTLSPEVEAYLEHAVTGQHEAAVSHVAGLIDAGWSVPRVLLGVIAPAQEELGRLWERGALSVAQEHVATAVTHLAMYSLYPRLFDTPRNGLTLVAATTPGDRHTVGLRVVVDLLQHRGWEVVYVGASCPVPDLVEAVVEADAALLLLGASMTCFLPGLRRAVELVRADRRCDEVVVMTGGTPFRGPAPLRDWVGADLAAGHAGDALEHADGLLERDARSRT